jgi:hypothetical protein
VSGPGTQRRAGLYRNIDGGSYLETMLVSAVAAILVIRLYLRLTGYPRIGGGSLHIAHMLWGGLLMLAAITLLLSFLGKRVKHAAALVAGVGFGTFIDELGKFISSDNDYFFPPTVGLIYVLFVLLFLLFRWINRRRGLTGQEYLVNAADMLKEVIIDGARSDEITQALSLLERSGAPRDLTEAIRDAVVRAARAEDDRPPLAARLTQAARYHYECVCEAVWFPRALVSVFALYAAGALGAGGLALLLVGPFATPGARSLGALGAAGSGVIAALLALIGLGRLVHSRLAGYRWLKRSVLTSIFFVQVFLFFESPLVALGGLTVDLVLLSGLNAMLRAEHRRREDALLAGPARLIPGQGAG